MVSFFKKTGLAIARAIFSLFAVFLIALIAVQLILITGINIVSTGRGTDFISKKINDALVDSGYHVALDALYYDPVRGFTIHDLSVSDKEGAFLSLDRFSLSVSLARSPLKTLSLSGQGGTLSVSRIPVSEAPAMQENPGGMTPFNVPNIYFTKIILSRLSFDHVLLGEAVTGKPYALSPSIQARIAMSEAIDIKMQFEPGLPDIAAGFPAPDALYFSGSMVPATLDFTLDDLSVKAPSYGFSMHGAGNLAQDGRIIMKAQAQHDDLSLLTGGSFSRASLNIVADGPIKGPALDVAGSLATERLKELGLSDITLSLKTENVAQGMQGILSLKTAFHEAPVALESALSYDAPLLRIKDIKGEAPAISLAGGGVFSTETHLFDGNISAAATDLSRYSDLAGITISGKLNADGAFKASETQQQSVKISASFSNGMIDKVKIRNLSVHAAMDSLSTPWPQSAKIDASSVQITDDIALDKLNASISETGDQIYGLVLKGSGKVSVPVKFDGSASLSDLTKSVPAARDINLHVEQGRSSVRLSGSVTDETVDLVLSAADFRGSDIPLEIPKQLGDVKIDLNAAIKGPPSSPKTDMTAEIHGIGAGAYQNASLSFQALHDGEKASMRMMGKGTGIKTLDAHAAFPVRLSLIPFNLVLDKAAPLSGGMAARLDLEAVSSLFLPPSQKLSGNFNADGTLSGTLAAPAPSAALRMGGVDFEDSGNGIFISDLAASANVTQDMITLSSLSATDGKEGRLSGKGSLSLQGGATNITANLRKFNVPRSDLANGIIDAALSLKGSSGGLLLSGGIDILEMNAMIPESFSSRIPQLNIVSGEQDNGRSILERLALDIKIDARNQMFVRGWGLDSEFGGNIAISGTANDPQLNGTLSSRRGRFEEFGKRFTLARADLRFQGSVPPSPYLDIEATTPAGDVTGAILFTGPVTSPSIKFSSTPALPEDEVLSRILFGKESSKISPFQAVQLAQTIRRYSGQGGGGADLDPLGMIRSATGLDDISVQTDESGGTNVDVGKYLTDNVYLEFSKGKAENSGEATIQIEVTPSVNIESRIGQDAQGGGGIFWKRDY